MRGLVASSSAQPYNLAVDPNDAGRLYLVLGGSSSCLWRSTDSGESWSRMDRGLSGRPTHPSMVIAPMLAITRSGIKVALLGGGRLARIGPGEDRWQDATPRAPKVTAEFLVADPHHASRLWRTGAGRLWRSDDGRRWEKLPGPENIKHVTCDAKKPGRLAVVASANAWLTTDGGRRWRSLGSRPSDLLSSTVFAGENLVGLSMSGIFWRRIR